MKNSKFSKKKQNNKHEKLNSFGSSSSDASDPSHRYHPKTNKLVLSADDSVLKKPASIIIHSQDPKTSSVTTPRRPGSDKLQHTSSLNPFISTESSLSPVRHKDRQQEHELPQSNSSSSSSSSSPSYSTSYYSNSRYPSLPTEWMKTPARPKASSKSILSNSTPNSNPSSSTSYSYSTPSSNSSSSSSHPPSSSNDSKFSFQNFSWKKFLLAEIFGVGDPGHLEPMAVGAIDNFLSVPMELEKLLLFGLIITFDSFLYTITYLPIRFLLAIIILFDEYLGYFLTFRPLYFCYLFFTSFNLLTSFHKSSTIISTHHKYQFEYTTSRQFDLMRGFLLLLGSWALSHVNMSWLYHYIRMQNTIKLYALTAMLEIFDKLFSSFGIDAIDSLFWKTQIRSSYSTLLLSFLITYIYVLIHSSLYFAHVSTLIVAINNADQSLLTILILNNFAEIKSFVMKKFDEEGLYQLVCSDIYERFKIILFYFLILVVGISQSSQILHTIYEYGEIFLWMFCSEIAVDWIKHAFIVKLNPTKLSYKSYEIYHKQLRYDIFYGHKDKITLDHSYAVTKTIGIAQYPLGCIFFRFVLIVLSSTKITEKLNIFTMNEMMIGGGVMMIGLLLFKVMLSMGLICYIGMRNNKDIQEEGERRSREETVQKIWGEVIASNG